MTEKRLTCITPTCNSFRYRHSFMSLKNTVELEVGMTSYIPTESNSAIKLQTAGLVATFFTLNDSIQYVLRHHRIVIRSKSPISNYFFDNNWR